MRHSRDTSRQAPSIHEQSNCRGTYQIGLVGMHEYYDRRTRRKYATNGYPSVSPSRTTDLYTGGHIQ